MNGEHLSGGVLGKEKKLNSNLGFFLNRKTSVGLRFAVRTGPVSSRWIELPPKCRL